MAKKKIAPEDRKFDRIPQFDARSKDYPIRPLLGLEKIEAPKNKTWRYVQLDQGAEGACTGFSACAEAAASPAPLFYMPPRYTTTQLNAFARKWYKRAQQLDEWPGENYDGSSVLGACKAGMELGVWGEYRWASFDDLNAAVDDIFAAISYHGPVMMGTNWYEGMFHADQNGYLNVTGAVAGGHAYLLTAFSIAHDAAWTPNNWGGDGQGWISRQGLIQLLQNQGEASIPVSRTTKKLDPTKTKFAA